MPLYSVPDPKTHCLQNVLCVHRLLDRFQAVSMQKSCAIHNSIDKCKITYVYLVRVLQHQCVTVDA